MISNKDLNVCMKLLADINQEVYDDETKAKLVAIGVILQREINFIKKLNSEAKSIGNKTEQMTVEKLYYDNQQLFTENKKLIEEIEKLVNIINVTLKNIEDVINDIKYTAKQKINEMQNSINNIITN